MKKIVSLILVITIMLLVACADVEYTEADTQINYIQDDMGTPDDEIYSIRIDKETGVNYIIFDGFRAGGITPRLNADGTPCVSEVNGNE